MYFVSLFVGLDDYSLFACESALSEYYDSADFESGL